MPHSWDIQDLVSWILLVPLLGYVVWRTLDRSEDRSVLIKKWIVSIPLILYIIYRGRIESPYTILYILFPSAALGLIWTPSVVHTLIGSFTGILDGGAEAEKDKPFYFRAEAMRRKGQINEALADVQAQLEKFPGDYEGYTKLAAIYMENLKDLPKAEATLNEFLELPGHPPHEMVGALHLLADWQLQHGRDAAAARATMERIIDNYPNSPLARAAKERIAHLGSFHETVRAREAVYTVKPGVRDAGLQGAVIPTPPDENPRELISQLVNQLDAHPSDTEAREKLAVLYASEYQRLDLASDQLEQLIALPGETSKRVSSWLNLLATLHARYGHDQAAAEKALRRVVEKFPTSAWATTATARLATLQGELKASHQSATKTMGAYDRDMGLNAVPKIKIK